MLTEKIKFILKAYGMTQVKASEIMGISKSLFQAKINPNTRNKFTSENLEKLENYLKQLKN